MTTVWTVDAEHPDPRDLETPARLLAGGQLVAFPTETVYGLGANALSDEAIDRLYQAKGRPRANPLIVHIGDLQDAKKLSTLWPDSAERLAQAFWPGPLTLVLPHGGKIPGGSPRGVTLSRCGCRGIRWPGHCCGRRGCRWLRRAPTPRAGFPPPCRNMC